MQGNIDEAQKASASHLMTDTGSFLNTSISAWHNVLQHPNSPSSPEDFRLGVLRVAGETHAQRYWVEAGEEDLEQVLALWGQVAEQAPIDSVDHNQITSMLQSGSQNRENCCKLGGS